MRQIAHLDDFVCDIWIFFRENVAKSRPRQNTGYQHWQGKYCPFSITIKMLTPESSR